MKCCSHCHERETKKKFYEESNLRPSDSEPQCSAKGLLRFKSLWVHSVFPSSCALDQTNHVLFYFLIFSTAMWCCFGVSLIKFVVAYTSVLYFFFLSQRLLNCPRHGEFSPNGIDLSKEWHFLFYFVQFFYALPAHKSRIYITKSRVSIKASYRRFTAAFKTSYRRLLLGFPLRPFSGHSRRLHPRQPLMEKITETPCISIARPPGSQSRVDSSTITYFDQFKRTLYRISEKRKEMI